MFGAPTAPEDNLNKTERIMDILASLIKAVFGSKADKDRKEIEPYIQKIKAVYPTIETLTNDELRARSEGIKQQIADFIAPDENRIVELKAVLEKSETSLDEKERISKEIDETTKRIDEKIEEKLDELLPEAFAIMKDTARRFAQNDEVVVTANDFDRDLAATKDFVRIEGDKAIYATHWTAGGNDIKWCSTRAKSPRWRPAKAKPSWRRCRCSSMRWQRKACTL